MGETLVLCGNAAPRASRGSNALRLKLSGRDANIALKVEDIGRRMVANIPDVLTDLLEVATYVYCADQLIARGGDAMQALGTDWRRKLRFIVPVREPDRWRLPAVSETLVRLLSFMSDDEYEFRFERAPSPASGSNYFDFAGKPEAVFSADEVVMFSGGLDFLAGAAARLANTKARLLLVSHQSSPKMAERQRYLAGRTSPPLPEAGFSRARADHQAQRKSSRNHTEKSQFLVRRARDGVGLFGEAASLALLREWRHQLQSAHRDPGRGSACDKKHPSTGDARAGDFHVGASRRCDRGSEPLTSGRPKAKSRPRWRRLVMSIFCVTP